MIRGPGLCEKLTGRHRSTQNEKSTHAKPALSGAASQLTRSLHSDAAMTIQFHIASQGAARVSFGVRHEPRLHPLCRGVFVKHIRLKSRAWMMRFETHLLDVLLNRRSGLCVPLLRLATFCCLRVFNLAVRTRRYLESRN